MNCKNEVTADTVFRELYAEMRRYRDLEHRIVTWWTTILLAIMAAFVGFGRDAAPLSSGVKVFGLLFVPALAVVMWRLMKYSNDRYHELRKRTEKYYYQEAFDLPKTPRLRERTWFRRIPLLGRIPQLGQIRLSGLFFMTVPMAIITLGFCSFLWIPIKGATQVNGATYIVAGANMMLWQTRALWVTAGILLATLCAVICYARAAQRSADAQEELTEATLRARTGLSWWILLGRFGYTMSPVTNSSRRSG